VDGSAANMFSISVSKSQSDLLVTALGLFAAVDVFDVSEVLAASAASSSTAAMLRVGATGAAEAGTAAADTCAADATDTDAFDTTGSVATFALGVGAAGAGVAACDATGAAATGADVPKRAAGGIRLVAATLEEDAIGLDAIGLDAMEFDSMEFDAMEFDAIELAAMRKFVLFALNRAIPVISTGALSETVASTSMSSALLCRSTLPNMKRCNA
jgi:hypothetical protein